MRRFSHRDEDTRQHDNLVRDADAAARKGERMKAIRFLESAVAWVPQISTLLKLADLQLEVDDADGAIKTASRAAQGNPTNLQRLHLERILGKKGAPPPPPPPPPPPSASVPPPPPPILPDGWEEAFTPSNQLYFWNRTTNTTSWERPNANSIGSHLDSVLAGSTAAPALAPTAAAAVDTLFAAPPDEAFSPATVARNAAADAIFGAPAPAPGPGEAQAPVDELRGRLSLDDLTAEGGALQDAVDGLRRLEGIAPTLAPAALRKLAEGLEQLEAAVRAENASE